MNFTIFSQGANSAIMQHHENVDCAINYLIGLYIDDADIFSDEVFNDVMNRYGLNKDGFCSEEDYIKREVKRRLHLI